MSFVSNAKSELKNMESTTFYENNLNKVKVKTLEEIKREKIQREIALDNSASTTTVAGVKTQGESSMNHLVGNRGMATHAEPELSNKLQLQLQHQQNRSAEQNGDLSNRFHLPGNLTSSSCSTSDSINASCGVLLDEDLEPHDDVDDGEMNVQSRTVCTDHDISRSDDLDETVSIHPGSTEFYEENDSNWSISSATRRQYPKLEVKVRSLPVDKRVVIDRDISLKKQNVGTAVQAETMEARAIGLFPVNHNEPLKEQTLKDMKNSRTIEWCSSLPVVQRNMLTPQNIFLDGKCPQQQVNNNGTSSSSVLTPKVFTTTSQPQKTLLSLQLPEPQCGTGVLLGYHEVEMSDNQIKNPNANTFQDMRPDNLASGITFRRSPLETTPNTGVFSRLGPVAVKGHTAVPYTLNKRKHSSSDSFEHGGKIKVCSLPNDFQDSCDIGMDIFWKCDLPPKGFCFMQLEQGDCTRIGCKFRHIPMKAVEEYQKIKKVRQQNGFAGSSTFSHGVTSKDVNHTEPNAVIVMSGERRYQSNSEVINNLLTNRNFVGAINVIEKMDKMQERPGIAVLERLLCCCSQDKADADTNAQVAARAFKLIGKIRGKHNRHEFTTLIECLCSAGQYVMAYEKLSAMKENGYSPTLDVFLNLIKSSHADPHWAFDLLDEIISLDLLKTEICSDLILLGSTSKPPLTSKVVSLYQETLNRSIKLIQKDYNRIIKLLCDTENWIDLCLVLCNYQGDLAHLPVKAVCGAMQNACRMPELVEGIVKLVFALAAKGTLNIPPEAWNNLLAATCSEQYHAVEHINQLARMMETFAVPIFPQLFSNMIIALSRADRCHNALEVFDKVARNTEALNDPGLQEFGLKALCQALTRSGDVARLSEVLHFMTPTAVKLDDDTLCVALDGLVKKNDFVSIQLLLSQCEKKNFVPSVAMYRKFVSALEQWKENPGASITAYKSFRQAYPVVPDESQEIVSNSSPAVRPRWQPHKPCKYYATPSGCIKGISCTFLHAQNPLQPTELAMKDFAAKKMTSPVQSPIPTEDTSRVSVSLGTQTVLKPFPSIVSGTPAPNPKSAFVSRDPYGIGVAGHLLPRPYESSLSGTTHNHVHNQGQYIPFDSSWTF